MADKDEDQVELEVVEDDAVEVEVEAPAEAEASTDNDTKDIEASDDSDDDQFKKAETSTQKRIDRLTKKMREAERQREEAINYAQQVKTESDSLRQRMDSLDSNYVNEYSNRVTSQMQQAEAELSRAIEMGDPQATVEAQRKLTSLAIQQDRAEQAKNQQERYKQQRAAEAQYQTQQPMPAQQPAKPDPKAERWALKNAWFGQDEAMTYAAFGIHKKLVEDEGFDPKSDEYYNELDKRISSKFGNTGKSTTKRNAQTVAGASRNTSGRSGNKVRLTPSQVAIAKKLGVPLEEYAKYVKE